MTAPSPCLRGIIPPLVTPLSAPDRLDEPGWERLIEHLIAGGANGLFFFGTTGEGPHLSRGVKGQALERGVEIVNRRLPVCVNISSCCIEESLETARIAALAGADYAVAVPPFFMPLAQEQVLTHFRHLADESVLPVLLYNIPSCTKTVIGLETVAALTVHERIVGIKDSSGDLAYFSKLVETARARPDWTVLVGSDDLLLDALRLGAHGGVNGGANAWPHLYVGVCRAFAEGNLARAEELQAVIRQVGEQIYRVGPWPSSIILGLKSALAEMGICENEVALPFTRHTAEEAALIARRMAALPLEQSPAGIWG